jgi:hypothetical protein
VGFKRHSSLLSKREETMKAGSLRESGLWWLSHVPGSLPSLLNAPGKSSRKSEAKAVGGISEQPTAEWQRSAPGTEVAFFLLSNREVRVRGWAPYGRWSSTAPVSMDETVFLIGRDVQWCENSEGATVLDSLAGLATG